jgi:hypothetical protein
MLTGIVALFLSSAGAAPAPLAQPAEVGHGGAREVRLAVEPSAPDPTLQLLELQLVNLHHRHDGIHLIPPLIILGAGVAMFTVGSVLYLNNGCTLCSSPNRDAAGLGLVLAAVGILLIPIGLTWLIIALVNRGDLSGEIDDVEAQIAKARGTTGSGTRFHPWVTPWARAEASGLALSIPF